MDLTKTREFFTGLLNIEREIIAKLRERGVRITAGNFMWNHGKGLLIPAPEAVSLEINVQGKSDNAMVSREQAEDCHKRVERMDVLAMIDSMVKRLSH